MSSVNRTPFNLIPEKWAFDPEVGPFIRELLDVIWQLRTKTGGDVPSLPIDNTAVLSGMFENAKIAALTQTVDTLPSSIASFTPDAAKIAALSERISDPLLSSALTPDAAKLAEMDGRIIDPLLGYSALPDKARIGAISYQIAGIESDVEDLAADVAAIVAGDPLLSLVALPDNARIAALSERIDGEWRFYTPDAARYGAVTVQIAELESDVSALQDGEPLLALSALADNARIAALRADIASPDVFSFTPDAARYGELNERVGAAESDIADLEADIAVITAGDPLLSLTPLPLMAKIGGIDYRLTDAEADIVDLAADIAALTTGDPILSYASLPDKPRISALEYRVDAAELLPLSAMPDKAVIAAVSDRVGVTESDISDLAADVAANSADIIATDRAVAALQPLHAKVADLNNRQDSPLLYTPDAARYGDLQVRMVEVEEEVIDLAADIAAITTGDPVLAYSALPDKAAIESLRQDALNQAALSATPDAARYGAVLDDLTVLDETVDGLVSDLATVTADVVEIDRTVASLQPLHAKLGATSKQLADHEALNESYFAYFEILLTALAEVANTQFLLNGPPPAAKIAALSEQANATNILAFPGPDALRYGAILEQLKTEVQNLRAEMAAFYSDRAKVAYLDNRANDMEIISWL